MNNTDIKTNSIGYMDCSLIHFDILTHMFSMIHLDINYYFLNIIILLDIVERTTTVKYYTTILAHSHITRHAPRFA